MGVIPDRSDFVPRLTQGGVYTDAQASVLADALDATVGQPASKIDLLEIRADLKEEIGDLRTELKSDIANFRTELKGDIANFRTELKGDISDLRAETRKEVGDLRTEVRVLAARVERLADRTLIRVSAVMIVLLTAFFGMAFQTATSVWPPPP